MTFPETDRSHDPSSEEPVSAPEVEPTQRSGLSISAVSDVAWKTSTTQADPLASPEPSTSQGLVVSAVRDAARAQTWAAGVLTTAGTADSDAEPRRIPASALFSALAGALVVGYGTVLAWAVPLIGSAGVDPWPMYLTMGVAGVVALFALRPRPTVTLGLLTVFWVCWVATLPLGTYWSPDARASVNAQASVYASALTMLALVGLGLTRPAAFRWLWLSVVLTTLPLALREAVFGEYLYPWHGALGAPVAVFVNPNNYATILVLMVGIALGWMTERIPRPARWGLGMLVAVCVWLIGATTSRAALLALVLVFAASALLAAERLGLRRRFATRAREFGRQRPWFWVATGASLLVAVAVAAAAAVSVLARVLPGDDETVRSDNLRIEFVAFALRQWRENPWFGTGAGTYERLWTTDPTATTTRPSVPPHNGFVEILSENGLVVAAPLCLLVLALAWYAVRPLVASIVRFATALVSDPAPRAPSNRTAHARATSSDSLPKGLDHAGSRHLVAMHVLAFVLAGLVISSPLPWFPWWLMLAGAVVHRGTRVYSAALRRGPRPPAPSGGLT